MVSVVIPTFNNEEYILRTIDVLRSNSGGYLQEIIVVDGGSEDKTVAVLKDKEVTILPLDKKHKAIQLNEGAKIAKAEVLYFLPPEVLPPVGYDTIIVNAVNNGYFSGAFRIRFNKTNSILKFYSSFSKYNWKICRASKRSLFVHKEAFNILEGYPDVPILAEYELIKKLVNYVDFVVLPQEVIVLAKPYMKYGIVKFQLVFLLTYFLYSFGVKKQRLRKLHDRLLA